MVFGPAVGPYHILKRGDGSGIQHISMTEIESYTDAELDILIGVDLLEQWTLEHEKSGSDCEPGF